MTEQLTFTAKMKKLGEPLPIESVEFRVQSISKTGYALLLAYKDARVDMDRLDEAVGRGLWSRKQVRVDGREYCEVSIWNPEISQWVSVMDVGVPSHTEGVKGEASDAFKRACTNFGSGRELYAFPLILVQLKPNEFSVVTEGKDKGKVRATFDLHLRDWIWHCKRSEPDDNGKTQIEVLSAVDDHGVERYRYPRSSQGSQNQSGNVSRETSAGTASQSQSDAQSGEKPWYNDFDAQKDWIKAQFVKGIKADAMIVKLEEKYRVNREVKAKIRDLAVATTAAGPMPDDDIPF